MPVHPLHARTLLDPGVDYWIDRHLCELLRPPGEPGYPQVFAGQLESLREGGGAALVAALRKSTRFAAIGARPPLKPRWQALDALLPAHEGGGAPDLAAWEAAARALVTELLDGRAFPPDVGTHLVLGQQADLAVQQLALARRGLDVLRGQAGAIPLAAPLLAMPGEPVRGDGPIDVTFAGDLSLPRAGVTFMLVFARHGLGELEKQVTLRWRHCVSGTRPGDVFAASVAAVIARRDPARFWDAIEWLYLNQPILAQGQLPPLGGLPFDGAALAAEARGAQAKSDVAAHLRMLDVCGVPLRSPTLVVGRAVFVDAPHGDAAAAEVRRLAGREAAG